jgi:hypothetical protein
VQRFDGFVAKYMGDGVLVCFGYPQAHEDDAERAMRAASAPGSVRPSGLVEEVPAGASMPVRRRDADAGPLSIRITPGVSRAFDLRATDAAGQGAQHRRAAGRCLML